MKDTIERYEEHEELVCACKRILKAIEWSTSEDRLSQEEIAAKLREALEKAGEL